MQLHLPNRRHTGRRKRRPRFTLRSLLAITTVIALAIAWRRSIDTVCVPAIERRIVREMESAGYHRTTAFFKVKRPSRFRVRVWRPKGSLIVQSELQARENERITWQQARWHVWLGFTDVVVTDHGWSRPLHVLLSPDWETNDGGVK